MGSEVDNGEKPRRSGRSGVPVGYWEASGRRSVPRLCSSLCSSTRRCRDGAVYLMSPGLISLIPGIWDSNQMASKHDLTSNILQFSHRIMCCRRERLLIAIYASL